MDCNKDETIRAKETAEKRFSQRDFTGAKRFASKAQNLNPRLEGISQMLATLDVYISKEQRQKANNKTGNQKGRAVEASTYKKVSGSSSRESCNAAKRRCMDERKSAGRSLQHMRLTSATLDAESPATISLNVWDPENFYDFHMDRKKEFLEENQVWAFSDGDDGMPRCYVKIHSVASSNPFVLGMTRLTSKPNGQLGPLSHSSSGIPTACGEFVAARNETMEGLIYFSQRVHWTQGADGSIRIYPKKGDVWALYKNWSPNWEQLTLEDVIYDMVEVVVDYDEAGVTVTPLVKLAGFKTVFRPQMEMVLRRIHRDEMFRFSHRVPSHILTGEEERNAPKGCWELDPAAVPSQLLVDR